MSDVEKVTLIFTPVDEEEYPERVKFVYKIKKGDYKAFADLILDFGGRTLSKNELRKINKTYPDFKIDINSKQTIEGIFGQSCIIDGLTKIKDKVYEIDYST